MARAQSRETITFQGVNLDDGDRAKFVRADAANCLSRYDATPWTPVRNNQATFTFGRAARTGLLWLCYKFKFGGRIPSTPYLLFPGIKVAVVRMDSVSPNAAGTGCSTVLTVDGAGFTALGRETPSLTCGFDGLGNTTARIFNDTRIMCTTPQPTAVAHYSMRVDFGSLTDHHPDRFPRFHSFDTEIGSVASVMPAGGAYNLQTAIYIVGTDFRAFGAPRCRFGTHIGTWANITNETHAICDKPRFPDSQRSAVGSVAVSFSPNGQCYPSSSAAHASFYIYNSQVTSIAVGGGPATSSIDLDINGEGFAPTALPGAACRFDNVSGGASVWQPLQVISTTQVRCSTPATGYTGQWNVKVLQNGFTTEPTLYGDPTFDNYDISRLRVSAVNPPGGLVGEATAVTVYGEGFASYGPGQLTCSVGGSLQVPGLLSRDSRRVLCTIPAASTPGALSITLSYNNGTAGSISLDSYAFAVYEPPLITSISPTEGEANGGTVVTITGTGFTALSTNAATRASFLRCRFGPTVQRLPVISHTDTQIIVSATWGEENPVGHAVLVALNRNSFVARTGSTVPRFFFFGPHPPAIVEVYFPQEATTIVIRFDSQPTNRAGMNGIGPCSQVLDDATSAQLRGTATEEAMCDWIDSSTLFVQLTMSTSATGGMAITLRPDVLWPATWVYPGSCRLANSMCASNVSYTIDADFPCDRVDTAVRELCVQPEAVAQAPTQVSSCPGTTVTVDGSRSVGGGIKPLIFSWRANPLTCDK